LDARVLRLGCKPPGVSSQIRNRSTGALVTQLVLLLVVKEGGRAEVAPAPLPRPARAAAVEAGAASCPYFSSSTGTSAPSASLTNTIFPSGVRSMRTKSPSFTCPVATRLASGNTTCFSIARFRWRAPYLASVPSTSKNSFTRRVPFITVPPKDYGGTELFDVMAAIASTARCSLNLCYALVRFTAGG
jgi:hypothetical protein